MKKFFRPGMYPVIRLSTYNMHYYCSMRSVRMAVTDPLIEIDPMVGKFEGQFPFRKLWQAEHLQDLLRIKYSPRLVAASIRNVFIPYTKNIRSIDSFMYSINHVVLCILNQLILPLNPTLRSHECRERIHTLKKDLKDLTSDSISHLTSNNFASYPEDSNEIGLIRCKSNRNTEEVREFPDSREEWHLPRTADTTTEEEKQMHASDRAIEEKNEIESSRSNCTALSNLQSSTALQNRDLKFNEQGKLLVFIDGACFSNGRTIAKAGYGVWFNYNHPLNVSAPVKGVPTNNNAEIQAATRAISIAYSIGIRKIKLHTDSQFLINCMTRWVHKWKRNNWMTAVKQPVKNKECLSELDEKISLMENVEWEYVEAHKGIAGNEEADVLAKKGATMYEITRDLFNEEGEN